MRVQRRSPLIRPIILNNPAHVWCEQTISTSKEFIFLFILNKTMTSNPNCYLFDCKYAIFDVLQILCFSKINLWTFSFQQLTILLISKLLHKLQQRQERGEILSPQRQWNWHIRWRKWNHHQTIDYLLIGMLIKQVTLRATVSFS